jgi:hypothetical protein
MDLIGPIGVGFTTARGGWDIRLHQRLIPFALFMMVRIVGLGTAHDERRNNAEHESCECDFKRHHISPSHELLLRNATGFCDRDRMITREFCQFYRVKFPKWRQKTNNDRPFFNRFTPL